MLQKHKSAQKHIRPRDAKFLKEVAKGKTLKEAALAVGTKAKAPEQAGSQRMKRITAEGYVGEVLDRYGLTDEVLIKKYLLPLLNAKKTEFFQHEGKVTDSRVVNDNQTRRSALDMALRIKGMYKADAPTTGGELKVIILDRNTRPPRPAIDIPTLKPALKESDESRD